MKRKPRAKYWAVVKSGKIVRNEKDIRTLLVFDKQWRAGGAIWKPGEKAIPVKIVFG